MIHNISLLVSGLPSVSGFLLIQYDMTNGYTLPANIAEEDRDTRPEFEPKQPHTPKKLSEAETCSY